MLDLLSGIRVVSFNHFLLGPMGIQTLGDLGADVIAVENAEGAWQRHWAGGDIWHDGQSVLYLCANRNKRSVAIDLKSAKGREIALRLVDTADVVAENFRPGVMEKLGLGYDDPASERKPGLIYASASGYGPDGPYAEKPGQDLLAQALFGMMAITGQASTGPRPAGASVIDHHGAALFAMGILAAIVRRQRTGQGCRVDASLMQSALDLQAEPLVAWLNAAAKPPAIQAYAHVAGWYYAAPYGVYATRDGHMALSLSPLETLAEAIGEPRLGTLRRQGQLDEAGRDRRADRRKARDGDHGRVDRAHGAAQDLARAGAGLCRDRRRPAGQAHEVPGHGGRRGRDRAPVTLVNHPVLYDGETAQVRLPPQPLGAQTREVLTELGLGPAEIEALAEGQGDQAARSLIASQEFGARPS